MSELTLGIIGIFLANASLILWMRSESRSDWRHSDALVQSIHAEIKDFHSRLCVIEERNKNKE
jgi:hypothetical protein